MLILPLALLALILHQVRLSSVACILSCDPRFPNHRHPSVDDAMNRLRDKNDVPLNFLIENLGFEIG